MKNKKQIINLNLNTVLGFSHLSGLSPFPSTVYFKGEMMNILNQKQTILMTKIKRVKLCLVYLFVIFTLLVLTVSRLQWIEKHQYKPTITYTGGK